MAVVDRHRQAETLRRIRLWAESETNREPETPRTTSRRVTFPDGCVFLAACSSGDTEEVKKLLERGADINTANVDGLTALHQACIDDNGDMVEFLVDEQADIDACDNEGWTPLHAIASCGYTEIARYLIKHGANVAAVNNDGDLAIDIADDEEMENLLREEMKKNDVDAEAAKREEEDLMMADANQWLLSDRVEEKVHPKTGATSLHVAASKGYINVMNVLLQAKVDINAQDADGWTPLHAAVHWSQLDACHVLVDNLCDMDVKNYAGHTVFDLADQEMLSLLEELKKKQVTLRRDEDSSNDIIPTHGQGSKRRSSVTRMSSDQKHNVITKTVEEERATLDARLSSLKDEDQDCKTSDTPSTQDAETERKNERNKQSLLIPQPQFRRHRPCSLSSLDSLRRGMPQINEGLEQDRHDGLATTSVTLSPLPSPFSPSWLAGRVPVVVSSDDVDSEVFHKAADNANHTISPGSNELMLSWRQGLRKTGSTSTVHEQMNENDNASVPRSASSSRIAIDNRMLQDRLNARRSISSTSSVTTTSVTSGTSAGSTDRYSWSGGDHSSYAPYRDYLSRSGYKPFYQRQQEINQKKEQERAALTPGLGGVTRPASTIATLSSTYSSPLPSSISTTTTTAVTSSTVVSSPASTTSAASSVFRRSYEPPKRDEETETQRKARAKHARQTRRSTQGISVEDVEKAEKVVSQGDSSNTTTTTDTTTTSSSSSSSPSDTSTTTQDVTSSTTTTATSTLSSSLLTSSLTNDRERTNNLYSRDSLRRRTWDLLKWRLERKYYNAQLMPSDTGCIMWLPVLRKERWGWGPLIFEEDSPIRTSFRRPREDQNLTTNGIPVSLSSSLSSSTSLSYVPRSQRNALSTSDMGGVSSPSGLSRTSSLRSRLQNEDMLPPSADCEGRREETRKSDSSSTEPTEKKESAASRARRKRNERRPTGKVDYVPEDVDRDKENLPEDGQNDEPSENSSRLGRYSASDVPGDSSIRSRPASYTRSTTSLDEYKKMYEEEKEENGKLRKELDSCKKDLLEYKEELDKLMKPNDTSRPADSSDKREKRALERKVSEYEEELKQLEKIKAENKKLKEENRALTRVVSKLSK